MFLGTSRLRWIVAGLLIVAGMALFLAGPWGMLANIGGVLLMMIGMGTFVYTPVKKTAAPPPGPKPVPATVLPPRPVVAPPKRPAGPRPEFEARDRDAI